jgi:pilus assembly protein CpaC
MHRTFRLPRAWFGAVLLGVALAGLSGGPLRAQDQAPPPVKALIVAINGTQRVQMSTKALIQTVQNTKATVAQISAIQNDPTSVLITGLEPGITRVTLTDVKGVQDVFDVVVQFDIEYLRSLLKRAVPTANVEPIPAANNTVILTGSVAHAEDVDAVLRTAQSVVLGQDRIINLVRVGGVQQVQLCVVVARVSRDELRRMAFDFLDSGHHYFFASTGSGAVATPTLVGRGSAQLGPLGALADAPGVPGGAPTNIFAGVIQKQSGFLAFLQALRDESIAKLMAEPRLVTLSGRPASFLDGGEQAVPIPAGLGQVGVQFEEFGTRLNFLPIVLGNGKIHLEVEPEVSNLDNAAGTNIQGTVVPGRVTQRVHTTVELESGQTFLIGGLIQHTSAGQDRKVPILGDLPFLGAAFRQESFEDRETELVIMVTPHLVDAMDCAQLPELLPGQETRSPDDFELFLEGLLEAPRGPRCPKDGHNYVAAYKNSPSLAQYPCAGGKCGRGGYGGSCGAGGCGGGCAGGCAGGCGDASFHEGVEPAHEVFKPAVPADLMSPAPTKPTNLPPAQADGGSK